MTLSKTSPVLEAHKRCVRDHYAAKVEAWNRLVSNPHTRQNVFHYMMRSASFEQAVNNLALAFILGRSRKNRGVG